VRLIDEEGQQVGVVPVEEARQRAEAVGLDLVEVGPNAEPPVVRILDWGKLKYEREKKERAARKKQHTIEVKEIKYRPNIEDHDYGIKTRKARQFLEQGKKVKVTIFFRYRQLRRPELGEEVLDRIVGDLGDIGGVESRTPMDGRRLIMVVAPKPASARAASKPA
jgi:translation initiation factor IF-3